MKKILYLLSILIFSCTPNKGGKISLDSLETPPVASFLDSTVDPLSRVENVLATSEGLEEKIKTTYQTNSSLQEENMTLKKTIQEVKDSLVSAKKQIMEIKFKEAKKKNLIQKILNLPTDSIEVIKTDTIK
jgi:hypothetical protein